MTTNVGRCKKRERKRKGRVRKEVREVNEVGHVVAYILFEAAICTYTNESIWRSLAKIRNRSEDTYSLRLPCSFLEDVHNPSY